mmetsp:Transcript_2415/g.6481  ORF Transcript_2415/g.6481 Transcript_2415/m.6481 type:complete len:102 (+) Transcript_2415:474-779(+)
MSISICRSFSQRHTHGVECRLQDFHSSIGINASEEDDVLLFIYLVLVSSMNTSITNPHAIFSRLTNNNTKHCRIAVINSIPYNVATIMEYEYKAGCRFRYL